MNIINSVNKGRYLTKRGRKRLYGYDFIKNYTFYHDSREYINTFKWIVFSK
jgi:hypothetical protein